MINFKEIAEKCLAGKLSGRFVCRDGLHISSYTLRRTDNPLYSYQLYRAGRLSEDGRTPNKHSHNDIIQFIPYQDMKSEKITINILEGMEAVQETVDGEIRIKFVDKKLTYGHVVSELLKADSDVVYEFWSDKISEGASKPFYKKVEVLRKLTNIRNYFGVDPHRVNDWVIRISVDGTYYAGATKRPLRDEIVFSRQEHAQAAIDMLGDELKYLFEPW